MLETSNRPHLKLLRVKIFSLNYPKHFLLSLRYMLSSLQYSDLLTFMLDRPVINGLYPCSLVRPMNAIRYIHNLELILYVR